MAVTEKRDRRRKITKVGKKEKKKNHRQTDENKVVRKIFGEEKRKND